jgi:2-polyprenyl-6-methoxyphenol hydroxylase-like FAD-dependent oxidoreductase
MNSSKFRDSEVLIAGAGPSGLVLAVWLTRLGVRVRIVDKLAAPETTSRAIGVQARTLEYYRRYAHRAWPEGTGHKSMD